MNLTHKRYEKRRLAIRQLRYAASNLRDGADMDGLDYHVSMAILSLANRVDHGRAYDPRLKRDLEELEAALAEDVARERLEDARREHETIAGETGRIKRLLDSDEELSEARADRLLTQLSENEDRMAVLEHRHPTLAAEAASAEV